MSAIDGIRLTREQAASIHYAVHMHLLDASSLGDPVQIERWLDSGGEPDVDSLAKLGQRVTSCARVLAGIQHDELPLDGEVLALLTDCEREAEQIVEDTAGDHPHDVAISAGRLAMLRSVLAIARMDEQVTA